MVDILKMVREVYIQGDSIKTYIVKITRDSLVVSKIISNKLERVFTVRCISRDSDAIKFC